MFGTPRPQHPQIRWGYRPPYNHRPQWINPGEPRVFLGQRQRFHQPRQPFQPGNDNFWCETCDRGFPTEDVLNKHKQQHQVNKHNLETTKLEVVVSDFIFFVQIFEKDSRDLI